MSRCPVDRRVTSTFCQYRRNMGDVGNHHKILDKAAQFTKPMTAKPHLFCLILLISVVSNGHVSQAQTFRVGVKGGASLSTVSSQFPDDVPDLEDDIGYQPGFSIFLTGERKMTRMTPTGVSLVGEIGYAQRGYQVPGIEIRDRQGNRLGTSTRKYDFDYAGARLLGKLVYSAQASPYLIFGPHLDVLLDSSVKDPANNSEENTLTQEYDTVTGGITLGGGVETDQLLPATINIEGRYAVDISDSISDAPREIKNRGFELLVGVSF